MEVLMIIDNGVDEENFVVLRFKDLKTAMNVMKTIFENDNDVSINLKYE